jgi:hypothetical protein
MKTKTLFLNLAVVLMLASAARAQTGYYKHVTVDGSFEDWAGVPPALVDDVDSTGAVDLREVYLANDDQFLYVRVKLASLANFGAGHFQIVIDADADGSTGNAWLGVGSELLIEDGSPWQQKNGGFNEGAGSDLEWQLSPTGEIDGFEARISRTVKDAENLAVFKSNPFRVALGVLDPNWTSIDSAPAADGITYEFAAKPPVATGTRTVVALSATWRYNDSGNDLSSDWLAFDYDDSQAGWSGGPALLGFGVTDGTYPVPVQTTLAAGKTTYYFRVPFTWDFDSSGIALVSSNYLSDGAVLYLNGAKVRRVRLPDGAITATTLATGGPASPGQAEVLTLPSEALVVGTNVLQVEAHQSDASPNELAFGLSLTATDNLPPSIEDPALPADRTVIEGDATTFDPGNVQGTQPLTYQWFKDTTPIPDATNISFTIPMVLLSDRGGYHVEISNNAGANKATSRTAVLSTTALEVGITNNTEPADRSVLEGESTIFSVGVTGSPSLWFQWYKDGNPLQQATNATYTIAAAAMGDAGLYSVQVSNRLNAVTSRAARLTVLADKQPPSVANVSGGGSRVLVEFSEAVDPVSAALSGNYGLNSGQVLSAQIDPANSHVVQLTTSALTFGQIYTLTIAGVKDLFGNAAQASLPFRANIVLDGSFEDWAGIPVALSETQDTPEGIEFKEISIANDDDYIYVRMAFYAAVGPLGDQIYYHVYSDADNDVATGLSTGGIGSEMMIENGGGYQQKNGGFNEGVVNGLDLMFAPNVPATEFEGRFSRRCTYDTDGQPVYTNNVVGFRFELVNTSWALVDGAPQAGGAAVYTMLQVAPLPSGNLQIRRIGQEVEISWSGAGTLEYRDSLATGAWTAVPGATNPYRTSAIAPASRFYRLAQ